MVKLKKVLVKNLWQALLLRVIRNECREFMTRDKSKIGLFAQLDWFLTKYLHRHEIGNLHCYLYYYEGDAVGYGLLRIDRYGRWISGGLIESHRGMGLGKEIFQSLVDEWGYLDLDLEVLKTNKVGQHIYRKLGFRKIPEQRKENAILMKRKAKKNAK